MSIKRTKECRTCGKHEPRGWTEADFFQCAECEADTRAAWRDAVMPQRRNVLNAPRSMEDILGAPRSMANKSISREMQRAAARNDPRAMALAQAMDNDKRPQRGIQADNRPRSAGTQHDPLSDPAHLLNPLNPFSPVSPLNPLNDWDSSSHRNHDSSASSVSSCDDDSSRHSSGYDSSSSDSSSYDSGSSSSGSCD